MATDFTSQYFEIQPPTTQVWDEAARVRANTERAASIIKEGNKLFPDWYRSTPAPGYYPSPNATGVYARNLTKDEAIKYYTQKAAEAPASMQYPAQAYLNYYLDFLKGKGSSNKLLEPANVPYVKELDPTFKEDTIFGLPAPVGIFAGLVGSLAGAGLAGGTGAFGTGAGTGATSTVGGSLTEALPAATGTTAATTTAATIPEILVTASPYITGTELATALGVGGASAVGLSGGGGVNAPIEEVTTTTTPYPQPTLNIPPIVPVPPPGVTNPPPYDPNFQDPNMEEVNVTANQPVPTAPRPPVPLTPPVFDPNAGGPIKTPEPPKLEPELTALEKAQKAWKLYQQVSGLLSPQDQPSQGVGGALQMPNYGPKVFGIQDPSLAAQIQLAVLQNSMVNQ